jgi:hypothetical protein
MKVLAGRAKDLEDVRAILSAHPTDLDLALIRSTLQELEQALHRSDLVTAFERARKRRRRR